MFPLGFLFGLGFDTANQLKGGFWDVIGSLNDNFDMLGFVIIGLFIATWIGSVIVYRYQGLDEIDVTPAD